MNIKTLLTLSLLVASFNAQSAVTACPSGWIKSADGLTCVFEEKKTETPNKVSNTAKPVCISGFTYSSTSMKCEKNTIASQFTANKAYAYMGGLKFGPNPQEEDKCLNFSGTQTVQPANSYQSGGGNCACNSGFEYNNLSGDSASCNLAFNVNDRKDPICNSVPKIHRTGGYEGYNVSMNCSCPSGYKFQNQQICSIFNFNGTDSGYSESRVGLCSLSSTTTVNGNYNSYNLMGYYNGQSVIHPIKNSCIKTDSDLIYVSGGLNLPNLGCPSSHPYPFGVTDEDKGTWYTYGMGYNEFDYNSLRITCSNNVKTKAIVNNSVKINKLYDVWGDPNYLESLNVYKIPDCPKGKLWDNEFLFSVYFWNSYPDRNIPIHGVSICVD
jgi:hypothetical protein